MIVALSEPVQALLATLVGLTDQPAWVIGGTMRDAVLGRLSQDVDVAVVAPALPLAQRLAATLGATCVPLDPEHDIARVVVTPSCYLDIARLQGSTLADDLAARDCTCNALAAPILPDGSLGPLLDPLNGRDDCVAGVLRACSPTSIKADPLRMLRVVRFATLFGWQVDAQLEAQIRQHAPLITTIAAERARDELLAILALEPAVAALRYLDRLGVLTALIPELIPLHEHPQPGHVFDVWIHTLDAVSSGEWLLRDLAGRTAAPVTQLSSMADDPFPPHFFTQPASRWMFPNLRTNLTFAPHIVEHMQQPIGTFKHHALWKLALLCHDIAKPATREDKPNGRVSFHGHQTVGAEIAEQICQRLRLSKVASQYVTTVVEAHMRPGQLRAQDEGTTAKAAYRFFRTLDTVAIDTLLHGLADHLASCGPRLILPGWEYHCRWVDAMLMWHTEQTAPQRKPLIDGHLLMQALGIPPGPQIRGLLEAIHEAQALGTVVTIDDALTLARRLIP